MNRQSLPTVALAAALVACGARTPSVRNPLQSASAAPAPREPPSAVIHVLTRDWSSVTDGGPPEFHALAGIAGCDGTRGIAEGLRAEVQGSSVTLSEPGPTVQSQATEVADGWIFEGFVGNHPVLFASERFTGTLRPIGRVPAGVGGLSDDSRGRAVLLAHEHGALWMADGHGITRVESLPGPVRDAAFEDAGHGAAVLRDGALHETRDGGTTWRRVALASDLALSVAYDGSALRVATNRGWFALDAGALRPLARPPEHPCPHAARWTARMGAARDARNAPIAGDIAWLRGGGRVVLRDPLAITVVTPEGRVRRGNGPAQCNFVAPWGDGAFVHCGRAFRVKSDGRLWFVDGPTGGDDAFNIEGAAFSEDGTRAAIEGRCPGEQDDSDEADASGERSLRAVCVYDERERSWRTVATTSVPEIPAQSWSDPDARRLLAMRGTTLFVRSDAAPGVYTLDTASGAVVPAAVPPGAETTWRYLDFGLTADGGLAGLAERCTPQGVCETVLVIGRDERSLTARSAPAGVVRVGFADASRGVVASESLDRAWRTGDGGATWEALPMPDASAHDRRERRAVACGRDGCSLGALVRVEGWGPLSTPPAPQPPDLAAASADDPPPVISVASAAPASLMGDVSYACALAAWHPSPWRLPSVSSQLGSRSITVWGYGTLGRVLASRAPEARFRADWWFPEGHVTGSNLPPVESVLGSVGRRPLVVLHPPALAWGRDGGIEGYVALPELPEGTPVGFGFGGRVAPGRDGEVGVALEARFQGVQDVMLDAVAVLDARGTLRASRLYPRADREEWRALVGTRGRWGLGRPVVNEALRVLPVDGTPGETLTLSAWRGPVTPCAEPSDDAATVVVAACHDDPSACALGPLVSPRRDGGAQDERARFELSPRGVCLRAVSAVWGGVAPGARDDRYGTYFLTLDARAGALEGFVDDGERRARLRCTPGTWPTAQAGTPRMPSGAQPGGDPIAAQLDQRQRQFAAGMNLVMPRIRGTLATSGTQNYSVPLQAGHCYKIIGVGATSATDLDMRLYDPANRLIDQDVATDNFPLIGIQRPLCPAVAGQYRLEVVMYLGRGDYGVEVFGD